MVKILVINSSANKDSSYSRMLVGEFVEKLTAKDNSHEFIYRDLVDEPVEILNNETVKIIRTKPEDLTDAMRATANVSEQLIAELKAADFVVIGSSMYNWNVSASLKAWLDQVVRYGYTFAYGDNGLIGLLDKKPTLAILSRGGSFEAPERAAVDMQKPYLANILDVMGLDVTFAVMEGSLIGEELGDKNLAKARQVIDEVVAAF